MATEKLYSPIDPSTDIIRLIQITRDDAGNIQGSLSRCSLSKSPKYIALSYAWGSAANLKDIRVNSHLVQIRQNLWDALNAILSMKIRTDEQPIKDDGRIL